MSQYFFFSTPFADKGFRGPQPSVHNITPPLSRWLLILETSGVPFTLIALLLKERGA